MSTPPIATGPVSEAAQTVRRAAALIRQRAQAATGGRWWVHRDMAEVVWHGDQALTYELDTNPDAHSDDEWDQWQKSTGPLSWGDLREADDAAHIAAWDPVAAAAVACWLDIAADSIDSAFAPELWVETNPSARQALAVARAYLREEDHDA